jgi:hypothetical protein
MFPKRFYFIASGLKIIGHGNSGNNLESACIFPVLKINHYTLKTYGRVKLQHNDFLSSTTGESVLLISRPGRFVPRENPHNV